MKRWTCLLMCCVMLLSLIAISPLKAEATEAMSVSDQLVAIMKIEEGFVKYPVWDYSQYTVGYGSRCPSDMLEHYLTYGITESEAELLLRNYLNNVEKAINTKLIDKLGVTLNQGQFDALVSFSYNMGTAWMSKPDQNIYQKVVNGAQGNDLIDALSRWCKAGSTVHTSLIRRRLSEANMYLNGAYSRTPPETYCYVRYNGNGGSLTQSVQGYDSSMPAAPACVATYGDYTFAGWYTAQVGGTKVESLTAEHDLMTLYAHWEELDNETTEDYEEPIVVEVTVSSVNLRKGPGTNYSIIDRAGRGEKFSITQVCENGGYTWGLYGSGWIALQYTTYDQVIAEMQPTEPETTEPETTEPDATEPETTEPETTEPETTEPETTEPETTEPETTEPETTEPETTEPETTEPETTEPEDTSVTGVVRADPYLCVRQGPGTGYSTVDTLLTGEQVKITEQKTVGSMVWGKISNGWVSMNYIKVVEDAQPEIDTDVETEQTPSGRTGKVTCTVLNIRSGAGVTYNIVGNYRKNTSVVILEQKTVGATTWGKTDKGWVSMDYVTLEPQNNQQDEPATGPENETTAPPQSTAAVTGVVVSDDVLRIRGGAGTSYAIVGFLNPGSKVTITETKLVGATTWGKIAKGWISMDYIKLDSTQEETEEEQITVTKTVNVGQLYIRSGAGTGYKIVGYLYRNAKVSVTDIVIVNGETWGKISNGWICLAYTK